jgi:hypothetical protein
MSYIELIIYCAEELKREMVCKIAYKHSINNIENQSASINAQNPL